MTDKHDKPIEAALNDAYEKGWCAAAQWANRDDLRHDTGSIAYEGQRDAILSGKAAGLVASLCVDVEPVALQHMACSDDGELRWMSGRKAPKDCELYAMPDFGRAPLLYPASTVASLTAQRDAALARVAELEKDAARYRLLRRGQKWSVVDGIGTVLRADELDAAVDAALTKGQP